MNILMFTNTFTPHVGGVARSVQGFTREFRQRGHRVLVVAPYFAGAPEEELDVLRFPAVQHFSGSDFSIPVPVPGRLAASLREFTPEIVHSHHPFLLGDTALRVAATRRIPVVFTHHTMYEKYTHYVPGDSPAFRRFVVDLVTGYCNLCDAVIAPSESVADLLVRRGVKVRIKVVPTGVARDSFRAGDGRDFRKRMGIPEAAFVVGHVGRLAPEKNPGFLAEAVARFLLIQDGAFFLVAGEGPSKEEIREKLGREGLLSRLRLTGVLAQKDLAGAYAAMNVFAFASRTETQGMVLAEAMAAGVPVVAIDAPGAREVVLDKINGRLLPGDDVEAFADALAWVASLAPEEQGHLMEKISATADEFSLSKTASRTLELYRELIGAGPARREIDTSPWALARRRIEEEWKIVRNIAHAAGDAVLSVDKGEEP